MADEEKEEQEEQQDEKPAGVSQEQFDTLKAQNEALSKKNQDYEYMLLDPEYVNFVASKGKRGENRGSEKPSKEEEVDFEGMSKKELVDYILSGVSKTVKDEVSPLRSEVNMNAYVGQVKECMGKYPDYLDYKDEMIATAKKHPTMSADEVYHLTKSYVKAKPKREPVRSELPGNRERGEKLNKKKGFDGAFDSAWKDVFGAKDTVG